MADYVPKVGGFNLQDGGALGGEQPASIRAKRDDVLKATEVIWRLVLFSGGLHQGQWRSEWSSRLRSRARGRAHAIFRRRLWDRYELGNWRYSKVI